MKLKSDNIDDLAIFGGTPAFERKLHVGQPNIGDRRWFMERVEKIFDSRWFTNNGESVQEFEQSLAKFLGVRNVIAVCNATIGLEIAIRALPLKGEVIVPALTFIATAHALQWQEITPVFCDIDPVTHCLDPDKVEALITDRTTGILGVHLWGRPCEIDALQEIADRHGLQLMFDAAHAFGSTYHGKPIGGFGRVEVFSFHATKFFNTFEGGAITTNDDELAKKIRLMTNFGFAGYDNVVHIGTNGKMSEISAAMGLTSLRSIEEFMEVNRRNMEAYAKALAVIPGMQLLSFPDHEKYNYQYVVVEYAPRAGGVSRDDVIRAMWAENVVARKYFWPGCHRMEPYRTLYPRAAERVPQTDAVASRLIVLPTGTNVSIDDIECICGMLSTLVSQGVRINERLAVAASNATSS